MRNRNAISYSKIWRVGDVAGSSSKTLQPNNNIQCTHTVYGTIDASQIAIIKTFRRRLIWIQNRRAKESSRTCETKFVLSIFPCVFQTPTTSDIDFCSR